MCVCACALGMFDLYNYDGIRNNFMDNQVGGVLKSLVVFIFSIPHHSLNINISMVARIINVTVFHTIAVKCS